MKDEYNNMSINKFKLVIISFCLLCVLQPINSFAKYVSHQSQSNIVFIKGTDQTIRLTALSSNAIEALYSSGNGEIEDIRFPSYAIDENKEQYEEKFLIEDFNDRITFKTPNMSVELTKSSMQLAYFHHDKLLLKEEKGFYKNNEGVGFTFEITESEQLLGGGERVLGMNRRGHVLPLYNKAHYGYTTESTQMYFGLPAIMSTQKYVLLFDNAAKGSMDLAATKPNVVNFNAVSGRSSYIVVAGATYPKLINEYVNITGKQPLPPRWAFGNFASRFGYHTQQEVLDTAQAFEREDMPLDALVLDLFWFGPDVKGHMGNLAWDKKAFPEPEIMIDDLKSAGINTVVITEPFILSTSNNWQSASESQALAKTAEGSPYQFDFYFGNSGLVDVFNKRGRDWFGQAYKSLYQQGVAGWWGDLGEPEVQPDDILHRLDNDAILRGDEIHNVYGHQWAKMVFNQQQDYAPNTRPMIMMRSGFAGSQRYGMIPWTGDVSRSWGGLKPQVELSLQMGLLGLAYTHSDLGGFAGGESFDAPMYRRWLQYGAFQPVYRPHAQENIAPEPVFHDKKTKDIVRRFIKLRYQLLPYNYTLAYENSVNGTPLMRPLFFEDESDSALVKEKDTYLWGNDFLVTPITDPNIETVNVNMPKGKWFNFWTDELVHGGKSIEHKVDEETIPVYVRAGAFIPMIESISSTANYSTEELIVHYYFDESVRKSVGQMYEDDGVSKNSLAQKAYELLSFNSTYTDETIQLDFEKSGLGYENMPDKRRIKLIIHNVIHQPNKIVLGKYNVPLINSSRALSIASQGAFWEQEKNQLVIVFDWMNEKEKITIY